MSVGIHLICELENVQNVRPLMYLDELKNIMDIIIDECHFTVVGQAGCQFKPFGCTQIYLLSESHFSCHTYPESNKAYIDIFCCDKNFRPPLAIKHLKRLFQSDSTKETLLQR